MADRVARTRANNATNEQPPTEPAGPPVKHCWYHGPSGRQAALVLKWRKATPHAEWEGYVAHTAPDGDGWALVTEWVGAGMLDPLS